MPSSRQARRIRSAISPRLAMTIFSIMGRLFDDEQRLAELDRIAVLGHDRGDATGPVGFDLVHHLHGLDDEDRKSTRLNSSHSQISYAVFCLKKKKLYALLLRQVATHRTRK